MYGVLFLSNLIWIDTGVSAIGCPTLKLAAVYWVRVNDDEATVGCFTNARSWRLECRNSAWIGEVGNCSDGEFSD